MPSDCVCVVPNPISYRRDDSSLYVLGNTVKARLSAGCQVKQSSLGGTLMDLASLHVLAPRYPRLSCSGKPHHPRSPDMCCSPVMTLQDYRFTRVWRPQLPKSAGQPAKLRTQDKPLQSPQQRAERISSSSTILLLSLSRSENYNHCLAVKVRP